MLVLLPKKVDGLADLEKSLSAATLAKWRAYLRPQQVNVALPKFKLETTYQLNPTLEALGMKRAFVSPPAAGAADFSGIDGGTGYLYISLVIHKAFVDVNETGTEAAAATVAVEALGMEPRQPPVVFHADHPFLFLICDNRSGSILFLGRLINPKD
jgi:serpin B